MGKAERQKEKTRSVPSDTVRLLRNEGDGDTWLRSSVTRLWYCELKQRHQQGRRSLFTWPLAVSATPSQKTPMTLGTERTAVNLEINHLKTEPHMLQILNSKQLWIKKVLMLGI